ncbi:MAG: NAD-dependent epimerase [Bacteroidales bacterium]
MKVLVTGAAGFIGYFLVKALLNNNDCQVIGLDNINDYYDPQLKYDRLALCGISRDQISSDQPTLSKMFPNYRFIQADIENKEQLFDLFKNEKFDYVCNLAAQAGVRYSLENPDAYVSSNVIGFINLLEACRNFPVKHFVYASSSSVYGLNRKMPYSTLDAVDHPVSLYAATKKSNELMAHTYSHLFHIPTTGLRFFTVYGPWGRPDMSPILFADAITHGTVLKVFNQGQMMRDFTYIDDIINGVMAVLFSPASPDKLFNPELPDSSSSTAPYKIYNIGNSNPTPLIDFIGVIEKAMGKEAPKEYLPMQPGDVVATYSDVTELQEKFGYSPKTSLEQGIKEFASWYKSYYQTKSK